MLSGLENQVSLMFNKLNCQSQINKYKNIKVFKNLNPKHSKMIFGFVSDICFKYIYIFIRLSIKYIKNIVCV